MNLSILHFINEMPVAFSETIDISPDYLLVDNKASIVLNGTLSAKNPKHTSFVFNGRISADFQMLCNLCLKPVPIHLDIDLIENFAKDSFDSDVFHFSNDTIDFGDAVCTNLQMALPMKVLCRDDCKGLCPVCGSDVNCHCADAKSSDLNSKLEVLKSSWNCKEV